jgi:hypothetical protein
MKSQFLALASYAVSKNIGAPLNNFLGSDNFLILETMKIGPVGQEDTRFKAFER